MGEMETSADNCVCLLCCDPVSQAAHWAHGPVILTAVDKFIFFCGGDGESEPLSVEQMLLPPGGVSLCGPCLSEVRQATEAGERVEEFEELVRHLQRQLLKMLEELRQLVDAYLGRMTALEGKISKKQGIPEENQNATRFREQVLRVSQNLKTCRRDPGSSHVISKEDIPTVEPREEIHEEERDDMPVSPPESPPQENHDKHQKDPDFDTKPSPPASPPAVRKRRGRGRPSGTKSTAQNSSSPVVPPEEHPVDIPPKTHEEELDDTAVSPVPPDSPPADHDDDPDFDPMSSPPPSPPLCKTIAHGRPPSKKSTAQKKNASLGIKPYILTSRARRQKQQCSVCGKRVKGDLKLHEQTHLPPDQRPERKFPQCTVCGITVKGNLRLHMQTHLPPKQRPEPVPCEHCGRRVMRENMGGHKRRNCPALKSQDKPFPCADCGKNFSSKKSLTDHRRRRHQLEKTWSCGLCGKKYKVRKDLRIHEVDKHPEIQAELPYKCGGCGRGFRWQINLDGHQPKCPANALE